jgi:hypothetical protein
MEERCGRKLEDPIEIRCASYVLGVAKVANAGIFRLVRVTNRGSAIRRGIVRDDDLKVLEGLI